MRFTTLEEWLAWLEQCHPTEIDLGLERTLLVAQQMQVLNQPCKTITVAGTNGKGSCVATITALLQATGCIVGTYTSPHLQHYSERICINSVPVTDAQLCIAFAAVDHARGTTSLTYFEFGTLAALEIFKQQGVDVQVLEVGLGGRLDAVNILTPDVAVVTSIALDHEAWLGNSRELIGAEKAGIYRAHKPAICADADPPQSLLDVAENIQADLQQLGRDFSFGVYAAPNAQVYWWWSTDLVAEGEEPTFAHLPKTGLPLPSVAAGIQAVQSLGKRLNAKLLQKVLPRLSLSGRMQSITFKQRHFLLDVAHNPQATEYLALQISALSCARVFAIVAMMEDKDRCGNLAPLVGCINVWCLAELGNIPRAAPSQMLQQDLAQLQQHPDFNGTVKDCIIWCLSEAKEQDLIVIFGSFFTVSEALSILS